LTFHVKIKDDLDASYAYEYSTDIRLGLQLIQLLLSYPAKEFRPPLTNVVHALLNLPLAASQSDLFPSDAPTRVVQHIIDALDRTIPKDTEAISDTSIDENLSPVFALLSNIYDAAPTKIKTFIKDQILPTEAYVP
jgi:hypothetical protein